MNLQRQWSSMLLQDSIGSSIKNFLFLKEYSAKFELFKLFKINLWIVFFLYFNCYCSFPFAVIFYWVLLMFFPLLFIIIKEGEKFSNILSWRRRKQTTNHPPLPQTTTKPKNTTRIFLSFYFSISTWNINYKFPFNINRCTNVPNLGQASRCIHTGSGQTRVGK